MPTNDAVIGKFQTRGEDFLQLLNKEGEVLGYVDADGIGQGSLASGGDVESVNGQTGIVLLDAQDVGAVVDAGGGAAAEAIHAIDADNATEATHAIDADNATEALSAVEADSLNVLTEASVYEDWIGGTSSNGTCGQNGWTLTTIGSAGVIGQTFSGNNNLGIIRLGTNAAPSADQGASLSLQSGGGTATSIIPLTGVVGTEFHWVFKFVTSVADVRHRIGLSGTFNTLTPDNMIGLRFDTGVSDTQMQAFVRTNAGAETAQTLGVAPVADVFYRISVRVLVAGTYQFTLYNATGGQIGQTSIAQNPASALCPVAICGTDTTAQKLIDLDMFYFKIPITR